MPIMLPRPSGCARRWQGWDKWDGKSSPKRGGGPSKALAAGWWWGFSVEPDARGDSPPSDDARASPATSPSRGGTLVLTLAVMRPFAMAKGAGSFLRRQDVRKMHLMNNVPALLSAPAARSVLPIKLPLRDRLDLNLITVFHVFQACLSCDETSGVSRWR